MNKDEFLDLSYDLAIAGYDDFYDAWNKFCDSTNQPSKKNLVIELIRGSIPAFKNWLELNKHD